MRILVEIELENVDEQSLKEDFFVDPQTVSIDHEYLKVDPEDDSFYLFKYLGVMHP